MASENETVAEVAKQMRRNEEVFHHLYWCEYADRIEAAHGREVAELRETIDANLRVHTAAEKADADKKLELMSEIVSLDATIAELRECLKEACDSVCFKCRFGNTSYPYYCGNNCDRMAKWRKALEGAKDDNA